MKAATRSKIVAKVLDTDAIAGGWTTSRTQVQACVTQKYFLQILSTLKITWAEYWVHGNCTRVLKILVVYTVLKNIYYPQSTGRKRRQEHSGCTNKRDNATTLFNPRGRTDVRTNWLQPVHTYNLQDVSDDTTSLHSGVSQYGGIVNICEHCSRDAQTGVVWWYQKHSPKGVYHYPRRTVKRTVSVGTGSMHMVTKCSQNATGTKESLASQSYFVAKKNFSGAKTDLTVPKHLAFMEVPVNPHWAYLIFLLWSQTIINCQTIISLRFKHSSPLRVA